jgi:hypothetical protein
MAEPRRLQTWQLVAAANPVQGDRQLAADQLHQRMVKTGRRLIKPCTVLLVAAGGSHLTRRLFARILVKITALPRPAGWGFLALTFKSRQQKGDGERHPQIGHGFLGGGPGVLETTRAVRFGAQLRSRPGARGTIACASAWSGSVKTQLEVSKAKFRIKRKFRLRSRAVCMRMVV